MLSKFIIFRIQWNASLVLLPFYGTLLCYCDVSNFEFYRIRQNSIVFFQIGNNHNYCDYKNEVYHELVLFPNEWIVIVCNNSKHMRRWRQMIKRRLMTKTLKLSQKQAGSQLPTNKQVLQYLFHLKKNCKRWEPAIPK